MKILALGDIHMSTGTINWIHFADGRKHLIKLGAHILDSHDKTVSQVDKTLYVRKKRSTDEEKS